VVVLDDLSVGKMNNLPQGIGFVQAKVQDPSVAEIFARERFEVVSHHAAHISVTESVANPRADAEANILGTVNLLACAAKHGVKRFVYAASGGATYGECQPPGATEDWPLVPESPYGVSKMTAERYMFVYGVPHGIQVVSLRYANVFGPQIEPAGETGVVTIFAQQLAKGKRPIVYGDGQQTRDFVFVEDVARANVLALDCDGSDCFNIGTGVSTTVNELLEQMVSLSGASVLPEYRPDRQGEIRNSCLNPAKAASQLKWRPATSLREGLSQVVELARTTARNARS
jgi:UDP-glucose 4-epimerase